MNCVGARFQAAASFLHFHPHVSPTARAYARTRAGSVCSSISVHLHIGDAQTEIFSLHLIVGLPDYAEVAENLNIICYTGKQTSSNPAKSTPAPRHTATNLLLLSYRLGCADSAATTLSRAWISSIVFCQSVWHSHMFNQQVTNILYRWSNTANCSNWKPVNLTQRL